MGSLSQRDGPKVQVAGTAGRNILKTVSLTFSKREKPEHMKQQ